MERDRYYSEREAKGETKVSLSGIADNSVIYILTKVFPSFFFLGGRGEGRILQGWVYVDSCCNPVFLNRQVAARYRALASIIPGRDRFSWNLSF